MSSHHKTLSQNPSFCTRPFLQYSSFNGFKFRLCCSAREPKPSISTLNSSLEEVFNSSYINLVRQKMLLGEKVPECQDCYNQEMQGLHSDRHFANQEFISNFSADLDSAITSNGRPIKPKVLDLRVGNICNLKCQSCFPDLSYGVGEDCANFFYDKPHLRSQPHYPYKTPPGFHIDQIKSILPGISILKLIGGEPSLSKSAHDLISYCIDNSISQNIEIQVHTNLTIKHPTFFSMLCEFKKVRLSLSMDGLGSMNEYLRYPSDWSTNISTFEWVTDFFKEKKNVNLFITPVLQVTNILNIPRLLNFLISEKNIFEKNVFLSPIPLAHPNYLNPIYFPKKLLSIAQLEYKKFLENQSLQNQGHLAEFTSFYNSLSGSQPNPTLVLDYIDFIKTYDKARGNSVLNVFPEFETILEKEYTQPSPV